MSNSNEVQKVAFDCLMTYKLKYLVPYRYVIWLFKCLDIVVFLSFLVFFSFLMYFVFRDLCYNSIFFIYFLNTSYIFIYCFIYLYKHNSDYFQNILTFQTHLILDQTRVCNFREKIFSIWFKIFEICFQRDPGTTDWREDIQQRTHFIFSPTRRPRSSKRDGEERTSNKICRNPDEVSDWWFFGNFGLPCVDEKSLYAASDLLSCFQHSSKSGGRQASIMDPWFLFLTVGNNFLLIIISHVWTKSEITCILWVQFQSMF